MLMGNTAFANLKVDGYYSATLGTFHDKNVVMIQLGLRCSQLYEAASVNHWHDVNSPSANMFVNAGSRFSKCDKL